METLRTNMVRVASSQYINFDFTSMILFNGIKLGAGPNGFKKICCDADDDGTAIEAYFVPLLTDFNIPTPKTVEQIYTSYSSDGTMETSITGDEESTIGPYDIVAVGSKGHQRRRVSPGKGFSWSYGSIKFGNVDGSDFAIDLIELLLSSKSHSIK